MAEHSLRKMLKFRLPKFKSKRYYNYLYEEGKDRHHLATRHNDYLMIKLSRIEHNKRHNKPDCWFDEDLLQSLINLMGFTKMLEEECQKNQKKE